MAKNNIGKVYRGRTKYIDPETKRERNYVVVRDNGKSVSVAKLTSIKKFDEHGRNTDPTVMQINHTRYGLEKPTGVYYRRYSKNRMSKRDLTLSDRDIFPNGKEEFKLSSRDSHRAIAHTAIKKRGK